MMPMPLGANDNFVFEYFEMLPYRNNVVDPRLTITINEATQKLYALVTRSDINKRFEHCTNSRRWHWRLIRLPS